MALRPPVRNNVPTNVAKDDAILGGGHFDVRADGGEVPRREHHAGRPLNQSQLAECCQLHGAVLQRVVYEGKFKQNMNWVSYPLLKLTGKIFLIHCSKGRLYHVCLVCGKIFFFTIVLCVFILLITSECMKKILIKMFSVLNFNSVNTLITSMISLTVSYYNNVKHHVPV